MSFFLELPVWGAKARFAPARWLLALSLLALISGAPSALSAQDFGVYMKIADPAQGTVAEVSARVETAIEAAGWILLSSHTAGTDAASCGFGAQVLAVDWPEYTQAAMSKGIHGAFAAPLRISVFQDELGVHVAAINPQNVNRTMVAEEGMDEEWARLSAELRETVAGGMGETPSVGEFGQERGKGRIGRTMGIMAGGLFQDKIRGVATIPVGEGSALEVVQNLYEALQAKEVGKDWGVRPAYLMPLSDQVVVMGFTGAEMESRSFSIVGKGGDDSRDDFACPGLDHSAAYPVGVVFSQEGDQVKITIVEQMYRMKVFFEDAGKMKFARNMTMPGSIEDEIKDMIRSALF